MGIVAARGTAWDGAFRIVNLVEKTPPRKDAGPGQTWPSPARYIFLARDFSTWIPPGEKPEQSGRAKIQLHRPPSS